MTRTLALEIDRLADWLGADAWVLVRSNRHAVVDFYFETGAVRITMAATPSDHRTHHNRRTAARRAMRRALH